MLDAIAYLVISFKCSVCDPHLKDSWPSYKVGWGSHMLHWPRFCTIMLYEILTLVPGSRHIIVSGSEDRTDEGVSAERQDSCCLEYIWDYVGKSVKNYYSGKKGFRIMTHIFPAAVFFNLHLVPVHNSFNHALPGVEKKLLVSALWRFISLILQVLSPWTPHREKLVEPHWGTFVTPTRWEDPLPLIHSFIFSSSC